jgi:hypothetical protein
MKRGLTVLVPRPVRARLSSRGAMKATLFESGGVTLFGNQESELCGLVNGDRS